MSLRFLNFVSLLQFLFGMYVWAVRRFNFRRVGHYMYV